MKCHAYFIHGMTVRSGTLNGELIAGLKETAFCGEAQQVGERRSIDSPLQNIKTLSRIGAWLVGKICLRWIEGWEQTELNDAE